ncbi:hypothetical protein VNI00_004903 [Paramarasmius palmivorus]|uniref:DUF6535 domain-containing protein n=1 Tax=Paramarasmius palmivorus TaxID=297713 RepID=A0AAW0DHM8_9AGAR
MVLPSPPKNHTERQEKTARETMSSHSVGPPANPDEAMNPIVQQSCERLQKEVAKHDEEVGKHWKEDLDTLLVLAGLLSAVVTAFTIESYRWLKEDPSDTTVTLLVQISRQLDTSQNITQISHKPAFEPEVSSIRINCFWFLSLILSLTSALFGLLCKQWLREHYSNTPTRTPEEALALHQLRRDSFERWSVSAFLSALPILLQLALLFFFIGILDLLRTLHPIPFSICFVVVMLGIGLYFVTTILPTIMIPQNLTPFIRNGDGEHLSYQFVCPYKSPQAWTIYRLTILITRPLLNYGLMDRFIRRHARALWDHAKSSTPDWSSLDLHVVRQFDQDAFSGSEAADLKLKLYELRAFEWAVTKFRDSPSMIPHLENILRTISPAVAMSAVLGRWDFTLWNDASQSDVKFELRRSPTSLTLCSPQPVLRTPVLLHHDGLKLMLTHQYWRFVTFDMGLVTLDFSSEDPRRRAVVSDLQQSIGLRFVIPFCIVDWAWKHHDPVVRRRGMQLLEYYEEAWKPFPGYDTERHNEERRSFVKALARHINRADCTMTSELLIDTRGQAFVEMVHRDVVAWGLYRSMWFNRSEWQQAIKRAQEVGGLPSEGFLPIPMRSNDSLVSLELGCDAHRPAEGRGYPYEDRCSESPTISCLGG